MIIYTIYGDVKIWTENSDEKFIDNTCIAQVIGLLSIGKNEGKVESDISGKKLNYKLIK